MCNADGSCSTTCNGCLQNGKCYPLDFTHCGPLGGACGPACSGTTPVCGGGSCRACTFGSSECTGASTGNYCKSDGGCGCSTSMSGCPPGKTCNAGPWICQ